MLSPTRARRTLFALVALVALIWTPAVLFALQDSTAVVVDKTGIAGALIDHYFGAVTAAAQSLLLWAFTKSSPAWKRVPEGLKWGILYLLGWLITFVGLKTGLGHGTTEGNTLTVASVLAAIPTLASGIIFKIGGHKVPDVVTADNTARARGF